MNNQKSERRSRTSAIFNLVAGLLFLVAAFNILTGDPGINWMYIIVGVLFIIAGFWGLRK
jgi:hypothetical protein